MRSACLNLDFKYFWFRASQSTTAYFSPLILILFFYVRSGKWPEPVRRTPAGREIKQTAICAPLHARAQTFRSIKVGVASSSSFTLALNFTNVKHNMQGIFYEPLWNRSGEIKLYFWCNLKILTFGFSSAMVTLLALLYASTQRIRVRARTRSRIKYSNHACAVTRLCTSAMPGVEWPRVITRMKARSEHGRESPNARDRATCTRKA